MKKLLLSALAVSLAATTFAGSYATPVASTQTDTNSTGAYVELDGGYALTNYAKFNSENISASSLSHDNGGFAGGVSAGYAFMPHLGIEAGFMMPFQKTAVTATKANKVTQYSFYGAGALSTSLGQPNFNIFALAGLGYTHQNDKTSGTALKSTALGFVGGVGAFYMITNNLYVGAKYLHFAGRSDTSKASDPAFASPQYFLVSLGYGFGM